MAYSTKHGKGLKAEHWTSSSIQMHTVVSYHDWGEQAKAKLNQRKGHSARKMNVDFFMSDDKHHDAFYVADNQDDLEDMWEIEGAEEILTISDGGPNHYKCRQHFRNMSKRSAPDYQTNGTRKRKRAEAGTGPDLLAGQAQPRKRAKRHHMVRGENHGKGKGDGFNAVGKACFTRHERRDKNNDDTMEISHINNACDCVRVGNKEQEKKRTAEDDPQVPRKGRLYVASKMEFHETSSAFLEERRDRYGTSRP